MPYSIRDYQTRINPCITQCHFTINVKPNTIYPWIQTPKLSMPQLRHNLVNYQCVNLDTIS